MTLLFLCFHCLYFSLLCPRQHFVIFLSNGEQNIGFFVYQYPIKKSELNIFFHVHNPKPKILFRLRCVNSYIQFDIIIKLLWSD